jgi:hypothetical protein
MPTIWETVLKQSSAVAPLALVGLVAVVVGAWKYLEHTIFNRLQEIMNVKGKIFEEKVLHIQESNEKLDKNLEEKFANDTEILKGLEQNLEQKIKGQDQNLEQKIKGLEPSMDLKLENVGVSLSGDTMIDEYTQMEMMMTDGVYQWGFDLTDFNPNGKEKFQDLLDDFGMEFVPDEERQFTWKNKAGDLRLFTANNPFTGMHVGASGTSCYGVQTGYLSYVGVECNSPNLLSTFLRAFREHASYIKEESNARVYV